MHRPFTILLFLLLLLTGVGEWEGGVCQAQRRIRTGRGYQHQEWAIDERGDSIPHIFASPVRVYSKGIDTRKWRKWVVAVKKTYPIAQIAKQKMARMEQELAALPTERERERYLKNLAKEIEEEYTPVLKRMTRTQGRILVKLIDRETQYTPYQILKEFRNGFVAGFWQTVGKIFGQDLKDDYDPEGEDRMLEQIVRYYEAGLL